jgi:hypothetical protein
LQAKTGIIGQAFIISSGDVKLIKQTDKISNLSKFFLLTVAAAFLFSACFASAADKPRQGEALLLDTYQRNIARLEHNSFGLPLFIESKEQGDRGHVDVYGIFDYPFTTVSGGLKAPESWCDIVALHPNVKACTYREQSGDWLLTFYLGNKSYQPPEETRPVTYQFRNSVQQKGYLNIALSAKEGPFGTEDHKLKFEALPIDKGRTFVHVSYEYSDSLALRLAAKAYFATLGRGKVGFTVTGTDSSGKPVYISGPRGAIERNAVRYYFAIQSYMDTLHSPEKSLFSTRSNLWYDFTDRYRKQLFDLDKKDYLAFKTSEHRNQVTLQQKLGSLPGPDLAGSFSR